jgi:alkylhydroperoxidase/carboxymuconolactone decarboxylase family protein YurZ
VFHRVAEERGLMEELRETQLPLDGNDGKRSYEHERKTWHPDDVSDLRLPALIEHHGWLAVGRGLTLRPRHHLNILSWLDTIDRDFADLWVKFCYGGMYSRGIVDDKTRLLCMIGDCLAVGEETNARGHMRGAMRNGASPREVLEVIFQTCVNFGMPPMLAALEVFVELMAEDHRLEEIGNPPVRVATFGK